MPRFGKAVAAFVALLAFGIASLVVDGSAIPVLADVSAVLLIRELVLWNVMLWRALMAALSPAEAAA